MAAALSSCSVLKSTCDASSVSSSCLPKTASIKSSKSVVFMSGASGPQVLPPISFDSFALVEELFLAAYVEKASPLKQSSLSAMGMVLLPKIAQAEEEVTDKDFREELLQKIDSLQQLVNKSLGDAKEAVTTKAEEAISSLKFGDDKAAQNLTEVKSTIDETAQPQDKLAQN